MINLTKDTYTREAFAPLLSAYAEGKKVHWKNVGYELAGKLDNLMVWCPSTQYGCGLFRNDGTSSYNPADFFIA